MSVLDLPIERQRELAQARRMTLEEYVLETKKTLQAMDEFSAKCRLTKVTEEEFEKWLSVNPARRRIYGGSA